MAAHILCHGNEILPNTFPPPQPSSRDHGMMSEYETPFVMQRSSSFPEMEGSLEVSFIDEELPTIKKPAPMSNPNMALSDFYDPTLCVTPERASLRTTYKERLNRGSDIGVSQKARNSQKVRFENFVEVKQMTPEGVVPAEASTSQSSLIHSEPSGNIPVKSSTEMFADHEPFMDDLETIPKQSFEESSQSSWSSSSQQMDDLESDFTAQRSVDHHEQSRDSADDMEVISILASDMKLTGNKAKSKPQKVKKSKKTPSPSVLHKEKSLTESELSSIYANPVEHTLARPEFNSTLKVGKELQQLTSSELDVDAAVKQKLLKSRRTKDTITEKATGKVNPSRNQFVGMISMDVQEDDLIDSFQKEKSAKAKPALPGKGAKPEDSLVARPDILDCLTPDLMRETASLTLEGLPLLNNDPQVTSLSRAFDVFRHVRTWENW